MDIEPYSFPVSNDFCPLKFGPRSGPVFSFWSGFFLSLYTARPSCEYYPQVYFVHPGLKLSGSERIFEKKINFEKSEYKNHEKLPSLQRIKVLSSF